MFLLIRYKLNQMPRTCCHTFSAGLTCFLIYNRDSILNMNRVKRTCCHAASFSKTSECTCFRSSVLHHVDHDTVLCSGVLIIFFCLFACTGTFHKSNHLCHLSCVLTHDRSYFRGNRRAPYRAGIDRSLSFDNRRRKPGTSCVTAATTVVSRKHPGNCLFTLINFHCELLFCDSQEDTDEQTYTPHNRGSNEYTCQNPFSSLKSNLKIQKTQWTSALP